MFENKKNPRCFELALLPVHVNLFSELFSDLRLVYGKVAKFKVEFDGARHTENNKREWNQLSAKH